MDGGIGAVLAVCGGGGNDAAALILAIVVFALWAAAVWAMTWVNTEAEERSHLILLLCFSGLIGGLIFFLPIGVFGDDDYLGRFFLALLVPMGIGLGAALWSRRFGAGRALGVSCAGAIFAPGGLILLLIAGLAIGTGCLS
jgi:hypothetical protein